MPLYAANALQNARPFCFQYADAAERAGDSGFVAADVGKFAYQEDDDTIWMLLTTGPTWQQLLGGGGPQANLAATTDPGVGDDSGDGYVVGSVWVNTTSDQAFICADNALGAAVWQSITAATAAAKYADLSRSTTQAINTSNTTRVDWDTTDAQSPTGQHFTSNAALTGTVSKNGTTTLTGSGTSFTTELAVGQVISVPGTAAEKRVVTAIASNTSLTVATAFAHTASGQTGTRVRSAWVCRAAGRWAFHFGVTWATAINTHRGGTLYKNDAAIPGATFRSTMASGVIAHNFSWAETLALWDFIELLPYTETNSADMQSLRFRASYLGA